MYYIKKAKQRYREKKGKGSGTADNASGQEIDVGHSGAVGTGMGSHRHPKHGEIGKGALSALIAAGAVVGKPNVGGAPGAGVSTLETRAPTTAHNKEDQSEVPSTTKLFWKKCGARSWSGLKYTVQLGEAVSKGLPAEAAFAGIGFFITFAEDIVKTNKQLGGVMEDTFRLLQDVDEALNNKPNQSHGACDAVDALFETLNAQRERMERMMGNKRWQQIVDKDTRADEVQDAMSIIKTAVVRLQYMTLLSIDRTTNDLKSALAQVLRELQWPCIDEASFQNSTHTTCTPETRTSAISQIRDWIDNLQPDCPPIFWLTGPAGMGKSTILQTVCTSLDSDDPSPLAASFFCSRQTPSCKTLANVVPTLVTMLARESRWFCAALQDAHRTDRVSSHPDRQMEDILFGPWRAAAQREQQVPLVVVVDALDELDGDGGAEFLGRLMKGVTKYGLKGIKFLVSSREDPGIAQLCKTLGPEVVIRLQDIKRTEHDIFRFLRSKGPQVSKDLLREVAAQSGNLFVYAATIARYALDDCTPTEQEETLTCLAKSPMPDDANVSSPLDVLYATLLKNAIKQQALQIRQKRLHLLYVIVALSPISVTTLSILTHLTEEVINNLVSTLHAVIYQTNSQIMIYHKSFLDYLCSSERSSVMITEILGTGTECQNFVEHVLPLVEYATNNNRMILYMHSQPPSFDSAQFCWFSGAICGTGNPHVVLESPSSSHLLKQGKTLRDMFRNTGNLPALEESIFCLRFALSMSFSNRSTNPSITVADQLGRLAVSLWDHFNRLGVKGTLDEVVLLTRQALAMTPSDHPEHTDRLANLGSALYAQFKHSGTIGKLEEAILLDQQALASTPSDHPSHAHRLANLGISLRRHFLHSGIIEELEEAILFGRRALAMTPSDHPDRALRLANLSISLYTQFQHSGTISQLEEAMLLDQQALASTPSDHPSHADRLVNLGISLHRHFLHSGIIEELEEAILLERQALAKTPSDHPDRAAMLANLEAALQLHAEYPGDKSDLQNTTSLQARSWGMDESNVQLEAV